MKRYLTLARPFTLLPPLLGIISGAVCAWGSAHNPDPTRAVTASVILTVALGSLCAAFLNAANNALNQIYDLEIDRINKPSRPLVTGELSIRQAWIFTWIMYALGTFRRGWWSSIRTRPGRRSSSRRCAWHECFFIYLVALVSTFVYSVPAFGRTKAHPHRREPDHRHPARLPAQGRRLDDGGARALTPSRGSSASIFMLFLLGAASTKDFSDMEGDRAGGCRTLPIAFGVRKAAWMIAPFFILPWLLMPIGAATGILTGNAPSSPSSASSSRSGAPTRSG